MLRSGILAFARIVLIFLMIGQALHAAPELKRVIVLDFKNVLKKKNYQYLESTITDAVRGRLKEKFAYVELDRRRWLDVAHENFIIEEDLYTYSAAMNLGLLAKQDVVIYGGYVIEDKKGAANPEIRTRVRILDLAKKKEIADFEIQNVVDATIFDSVEKMADRIVKEAGAVLPNADAWARGELRADIPTFNQLSLRGMYSPVNLDQSGRQISVNEKYAGTSFRNVIGAAVDFQHFGIFSEHLGFSVQGALRIANDKFTYAVDGTTAPGALQSFQGTAGLTWRQYFSRSFYLQPLIGGGVQYDIMKFTFNSQTVSVMTPTGEGVSGVEYSHLSPLAYTGLRFGYAVNSWLFVETGIQYALHFYASATGQSLFANAGIGFRL